MKHPLLKLEPLVWFLFGQGILLGTMLVTGWLLVVCIGVPLGIVSGDGLAYTRALELGGSLPGRVVLFSLAALPLWKAAHHMRHLSIDQGGAERDAIVGPLMYGVAALGSLLALVAVVRL